jgi:putative DNA primase/helicase
MLNNDLLQELKNIAIEDVCNLLNIKNHSDCITGHESTHHTCFNYNTKENYWKCFNCLKAGDVIELVKIKESKTFRESCLFLAENFRPDLRDELEKQLKREDFKPDEDKKLTDILMICANFFNQELHKPENKKAYDYLINRGLTEETIDNKLIGYISNLSNLLINLKEKGYTTEDVLSIGLFTLDKNNQLSSYLFTHDEYKIFFPYWHNHKVKFFITRNLNETNSKNRFRKGLIDNKKYPHTKLKNILYGLDNIPMARKENFLVITEGIMDSLLLEQLNIPVISPITINISEEDIKMITPILKNIEKVYIIFDNEANNQGNKGAIRIAQNIFRKYNQEIIFVTLPREEGISKIDVADYIKSGHNKDDILSLCNKGVKFIEYMTNNLSSSIMQIKEEDEVNYAKEKSKLINESGLFNCINDLQDEIVKTGYINLFSKKLNLSKSEINNILKKANKTKKEDIRKEAIANFVNYNDMWNAEYFIKDHGENVRFCNGLWYIWNGSMWQEDKLNKIHQLSKNTLKNMEQNYLPSIEDEKQCYTFIEHLRQSGNKIKKYNMIELAKDEEGISILPETLNQDIWLLNLNNGTFNLSKDNFTLKPHNKKDYITKKIDINYNQDAKCELWLKFLNKIFNNNQDVIKFVQKSLGYSLTGSTQEQCLFILHGEGSNGKSTFIDTIEKIMGEYAKNTPPETLMTKISTNNASPDICRMKGVRFIPSVETEEDKTFSEVLLKQLTGNDTISARKLYQDFESFKIEGKYWIACNHKPNIRGTDNAIWRRIRTIPFNVTIADNEKDKDFANKLLREKEGILNWIIQGCKLWHLEGLEPVEDIKNATNEYRNEQDIINAFIDECCVIGSDKYTINVSDFYKAYKDWCENNGEIPISGNKLAKKMKQRKFEKKRNSSGLSRFKWFYEGIGINKPEDEEDRSFNY